MNTQSIASPGASPGFSDVVGESQATFRLCLQAMSRPGQIQPMSADLDVSAPLHPNSAAVLLSLSDYETTVWLEPGMRAVPEIGGFLQFHTGSRLVEHPGDADFAVISDLEAAPSLSVFKQGTLDYPDRSTTLIVQVNRLLDSGPVFKGPGIETSVRFKAEPTLSDFAAQLRANHLSFPCGVDLFFVTQYAIAALPRSSVIEQEG